MLSLLLLLACGGDKDDTGETADTAETGDTADSGDTTDSGDSGDTNTAECVTLNSGTDWAWDGECPRMPTPCDIVVEGCTLGIDYEADGGMTMGMPYAGTIVGDTITFEDGDSVSGCVGTIVSADEVTGSCEDGCTFTLTR